MGDVIVPIVSRYSKVELHVFLRVGMFSSTVGTSMGRAQPHKAKVRTKKVTCSFMFRYSRSMTDAQLEGQFGYIVVPVIKGTSTDL